MLFPINNEIREVQDLSGIWKFKVDTHNVGLEEKWNKYPLKDYMFMAVPASYNDIVTEAEIREHIGWVWYETEAVISNAWKGKRLVIRVGSATHHAVLFVNGEEVARHKGGYLPFEADISDIVKPGTKIRITIAVSNVLDWSCIPCGEIITNDDESRFPKGYKYQETYFDFYNYSGLHRPVKLYSTPKIYVEDITITTELEGNKATVKYSVKLNSNVNNIKLKVVDENDNIVGKMSIDGNATDENVYCGEISLINPHLWQPGAAYMYDLVVEADEDIYSQPFGIRTVKVEGDKFLINGKEFYFKGFGKHEDSDIHGKGLDNALNVKDFNILKWMGANSFRTSHYPYSEEILDLADREGMVIIGEVPAVGMCFWDGRQVFIPERVNEKTLEHHVQMIKDMYQRDKNHPSIMMWSIANEAATHEENALPYFEKVAETIRKCDDTRPITIVHTTNAAGDKMSHLVDVICLNRYCAWYTDHSHLEVIGLQLKKELLEWHDKYKKPMIMSEYGADTIAGMHKLPSVAFTEEFQCDFLNEYHKVFDQLDFVIGEHVWAFADFATKQGVNRIDGNKKGVFTRNRQPKMAAHMLKERWTNM